eukprot:CAMPEP_0183339494 /NCGR_PEP_ID=MMETSP0164_2-20130417/6398_1 /TAXON_ID=221442 /ORGANISM="Coccolithus pelagicus ssp braarudi, Strain PLY182g" /LENGTH=123 /DNA_ID=CAMNT_0025509493 /DNA_START=102 /DNA_END=470 /DNA_ORIENTATION=-
MSQHTRVGVNVGVINTLIGNALAWVRSTTAAPDVPGVLEVMASAEAVALEKALRNVAHSTATLVTFAEICPSSCILCHVQATRPNSASVRNGATTATLRAQIAHAHCVTFVGLAMSFMNGNEW